MPENTENISPFEQMKKILSDKEKAIDAKLEELTMKRKEWEAFQKEVLQKAQEVKEAQEAIQKEKKEIAIEWDKIRETQENLQKSMEEVMAERVLQEQKSLSDFVKSLEDDVFADGLTSKEGEINLDDLRKSVGIEVSTKKSIQPPPVIDEVLEDKIPDLFVKLEKEITKSYSRWTKLELLPERYCLQFGEKEIRFFDSNEKNKVPYVQIILFTQNSRTYNRMLSNLAGVARVVPEWSINTNDNKIVCTMQFTNETKVSVVLKKCNDFMKNYLS